eukprot:Ihof_evm1s780 gene=Ihof_evmTU1s780
MLGVVFVTSRTSDEKGKGNEGKGRQHAPPLPRPTHFLALPMLSERIKRHMKTIQKSIVTQEPYLEPAMVNINRTHITLFVLNLDTDEKIEMTRGIVRDIVKKACYRLQTTLALQVKGLKSFSYDRVLFMNVTQNHCVRTIESLVTDLYMALKEIGATIGPLDFTPHVTVAKMSQIRRRMGNIRNIPPAFYKSLENMAFSTE